MLPLSEQLTLSHQLTLSDSWSFKIVVKILLSELGIIEGKLVIILKRKLLTLFFSGGQRVEISHLE